VAANRKARCRDRCLAASQSLPAGEVGSVVLELNGAAGGFPPQAGSRKWWRAGVSDQVPTLGSGYRLGHGY
jgi:hypothetical protein